MCGIAGAWSPTSAMAVDAVQRMCDAMVRRGPDDWGVETCHAGGSYLALGNRRLAIIDPTRRGHQPMRDDESETVLAFNGMIYNYREIRRRLARAGASFTSDCDTEVVLRAYQHWGEQFVHELHGMFALAIWDGRRDQLLLVRDRLGIKPLYYAQVDDQFFFASQVKALLCSQRVPVRLSKPGIESYLTFGCVSDPMTAFEGVHALGAGHVATVRPGSVRSRKYWSLPSEAHPVSRADATEELRHLLSASVGSHLVSDAPLGIFLSGGLDSSIIGALASRAGSELTTISVDFDEADYSEAHYVDMMVDRLGSAHERVMFRSRDLVDLRTDAFSAMDQPSVDGLNTFIVSKVAASQGLKVALSGLGADELFDGYGHVRRVQQLESAIRVPSALTSMRRILPSRLMPGGEKLDAWLSGEGRPGQSYEFLRRTLTASDVHRLMRQPHGFSGEQVAPALIDPALPLARQVMDREVKNYLTNTLLRDADAMSMANSLEVRVPMLDDRLVAWAAGLPDELRQIAGKRLLSDAVSDLVPQEIRTRRKTGFQIPFGPWLRGPLRPEAEQEFREPAALLSEVIDSEALLAVWRDFAKTGRRWVRAWSLYSLSTWTRLLPKPTYGHQHRH